ncbi:Pheromone-binding protein [Eumeta japonica]|uniref:Pheromone-binding protein n=1 Tax=Eumeta variegata TaxID=151549 RepID=A0A4C1UJ03_EUMVA|nr:Pheromone-binding protein [Eumeta japonica]
MDTHNSRVPSTWGRKRISDEGSGPLKLAFIGQNVTAKAATSRVKSLDLHEDAYNHLKNYWDEKFELVNRDFGCLIICMSKKLDLIDEDGKLHHGKAKEFATAHGAVGLAHELDKYNVLNERDSGIEVRSRLRSHARPADEETAQQLIDIVHNCEKQTSGGDDPCATMVEVAKCFRIKIHELKWVPSMEILLDEGIKIRRNEESSSETENRLSIHRQYVAQSRARESSTERSQRLAEQNMRTAQIRARESSLQRSQRLAEQNESSSERFQRLQDQRERQQTSRARSRNQVLAHSNRSAFRYDPQIDYAQQSSVQIGDMNKICPKCSAKKWVDETNGMCCASGKRLRAEEYIHLRDALNQDGNVDPSNIGQRVILPYSFTGSPRYLHEKTQDAMTYVRNYGRPDLFVTFTCNPEWPEIKAELLPDQRSFDRHDIISRVFHLKMKGMLEIVSLMDYD